MKKIVITGASGFVGSHLIDHLLSQGDSDIYGTYRLEKPQGEGEHLHFIQVDLEKKEEVEQLIDTVQPEWVFHLAAQSNVPVSIKDPISTFHANVDSLLHLLLTLRERSMLTQMLLVSSAEVYGFVEPQDIPVDENTPFRPGNPYAVSKITQDYLGYQYFKSYKMPIVRVRPFSHIGPRQSANFVVSDFAKQIVEIEKQKKENVLKVGNLEAERDFTDVRDMVKLYPLLLEKGIPGEVYNAGSGNSIKIKKVLDILLSFSEATITVEEDPEKMRPSDIPILRADTTKVLQEIGWQPTISLEETLKDTLEYWRKVI